MALPSDRAVAASPSSPAVSPVPASIPSADEKIGFPDCPHCRGWGFYTVEESFERILCGNCKERHRWLGLVKIPQSAWCVWNKNGHRPTFWHDSRESAENEAARLARKFPGKTFIVFQKVVNIFATPDIKES